MAAPVSKGDELELHVDSLAYGGNGVARLNGFVVFVRRGLPGDTVRATRDEGQARLRRGDSRPRCVAAGRAAGRRAVRRTTPRAAAAASRISPTRRRSRRSRSRSRDALVRIGARRRTAARGDPPGRVAVPLPQQARVLVHRHAAGRGARLPPGRALGRGARGRALLADHRARQRDPRDGAGLGAGGGAAGVRPGRADRLPAPPRRARGAQHRPGARPARHRARRSPGRRPPRRRAARASPRCARSTGR